MARDPRLEPVVHLILSVSWLGYVGQHERNHVADTFSNPAGHAA